MAFLRIFFRLVLATVVFAPVIVPLLVIESEPLVAESDRLLFDDVRDAKAVLKRFDPRLMDSTRTTTVRVSDVEISKAVGAALTRLAPLRARVEARPNGVWIGGTAELPVSVFFVGRYINVQMVVAPSQSELVVSQLSIGSIGIPSWIVKPAMIFAGDWFIGEGKGEPAYDSIRSVEVNGNRITVAFQPPGNLVADVKAAAGRAVHLGNSEAVRDYYRKLTEVSLAQRTAMPVSMSAYMGPLFKLAKKRSYKNDPISENRSLILALALYFGDSRFELLLRDVKPGDFSDGTFDPGAVKLERRHDWVQHFATTAGLQVAAGSGISNFIGEAKEINDADGPSGFSFTDIAADRTGVRFAEVATRSTPSARQLQSVLSEGTIETDFFPQVSDLPEGLSEVEFKKRYIDIDSEAYGVIIRQIDGRIESLALYQ